MARFSKKLTPENDEAITAEAEEVLLPGEESADNENADSSWQAQLNEAFDQTTPKEEEKEMTETASIPAQETTLTERLESDGFVVTDAAAKLLEEVEGNSVKMMEIDSLPKDAKIVKMQLEILAELADEYKVLRKELTDGTSNKDELIAGFLSENEEIHAPILDDEGNEVGTVDLKDAFAEAQEARDKAIKAANDAEAALMAFVEAELKKSSGGLLSEEEIAAKTAEIKLKYSEYAEQHKAAKSFLDNYRNLKNDSVGEIHQYVTHIDRPSGRATTGNASRTTGGPTAGRSVHVSGAFFSKDNGSSWEHSTSEKAVPPSATNPDGKLTLSNPASLAVDLGKAFSTTVNKDDIVDAWYAASSQTRETASKANMPNEKEFSFTLKDGNGAEHTVLLKIQKRQ